MEGWVRRKLQDVQVSTASCICAQQVWQQGPAWQAKSVHPLRWLRDQLAWPHDLLQNFEAKRRNFTHLKDVRLRQGRNAPRNWHKSDARNPELVYRKSKASSKSDGQSQSDQLISQEVWAGLETSQEAEDSSDWRDIDWFERKPPEAKLSSNDQIVRVFVAYS